MGRVNGTLRWYTFDFDEKMMCMNSSYYCSMGMGGRELKVCSGKLKDFFVDLLMYVQ